MVERSTSTGRGMKKTEAGTDVGKETEEEEEEVADS